MEELTLEFGQNKVSTLESETPVSVTLNAQGSYILYKQGINAVISAGCLPTTYLKTVNGIENSYNYTYKKIIYTVTEQKNKYTVTQRVYKLSFENNSDKVVETLQTTELDSANNEKSINPVVYKNITQAQLDKIQTELGITLIPGENTVFARYTDASDTTAENKISMTNQLFNFSSDEQKGSVTLENYFGVGEDSVKLNDISIKTILESTNGIGLLGDVNAINSLTIDYGTFLDETITGGKAADKLYASSGDDTIRIAAGTALGGDTVYDTNSGDNIVFGVLDGDGAFISDTNIENLTFKKSGEDLIISRPYDTKKNDIVTVSGYFNNEVIGIKVNGVTVDSTSLVLTLEGNAKKSNTLSGSDYNDTITGGKKKDSITTGAGKDIVTGGKGNDTINIDGSGEKTIKYYRGDGNDIIIFSNDDATASISYTAELGYSTGAAVSKSGNNLVLTRNYTKNNVTKVDGTIIIQDYFKDDGKSKINNTIKFGNKTVISLIASSGLAQTGNSKKSNTLIGTSFNDVITGGKKADVITTGTGNDVVTAGKGKDSITINGSGKKEIRFSKGDGDDLITFSNSSAKLNLVYDSGVKNFVRNDYTCSKSGNDLLITRYYVTKNKSGKEVQKADGTTTIKDYFNADGTVKVSNEIYLDNSETAFNINDYNISVSGGVYDSEIKTTIYTGSIVKDIFTYNGKNSVIFEDKNITDDTYNITLTKGKSDLTIDDAGGSDVMNITNKTSDLRLIFNMDKDGKVVKYTDDDGDEYYSLLVFNKNNVNYNGFKKALGVTEIFDYFKSLDESAEGHYALGDGAIEKISTKDINEIDMDSWINYISGEVVSWYSSVNTAKTTMDILNSDDKDAIKSLLQVFSGASYDKIAQ